MHSCSCCRHASTASFSAFFISAVGASRSLSASCNVVALAERSLHLANVAKQVVSDPCALAVSSVPGPAPAAAVGGTTPIAEPEASSHNGATASLFVATAAMFPTPRDSGNRQYA